MSMEGIPRFPDFRQITLQDRQAIESFFSTFPAAISERTFGSLYTWRNYERRGEISEFEDHLIISWFKPKFGRVLLPPVGPEATRAVASLCKVAVSAGLEFEGIYGLVGPETAAIGENSRQPEPLRDDWDYVYRTEDLIRLEGPRYHTQRKELKKATSQHNLDFEPMTESHRKACLELEEKWCDLKHCAFDKYSRAEDFALRESIGLMKELGYMGGVVLADGELQALTVGEKLNENTAVVHFEKANPSIRGLYQVINQQFCEKVLKGFEFVNREQDVGEPGLRTAKERYHPHHFVEKEILMFG